MKLPTKTLLTLMLGLSSAATYGTTFDYSYTFSGSASGTARGHVVTGSLDGDLNGNFVDNVANVSVFFDGTAMTGTVFTGGWNENTVGWNANATPGFGGPAIVSFAAALNNFSFINSDYFHGIFGYDAFFSMLHNTSGESRATDYNRLLFTLGSNLAGGDEPIVAANWSLTARASETQPVPDGGNMAMMLGGGLVCLVAAGRRKPSPLNQSKDQALLS